MTRAELKLELIRICHHHGRDARNTIQQFVTTYEKEFEGLVTEGEGAESAAAPKSKGKAAT